MEERGGPAATGYLAPTRPRFLPWALANFGLFLLVTLLGAVVMGVLDAGHLGVGQGVFAASFLIPVLFPGWLLHLLIIGFLPPAWPRSKARLVAIVASPLWMIFLYATDGVFISPFHAVALAYSLIARLRQPRGA